MKDLKDKIILCGVDSPLTSAIMNELKKDFVVMMTQKEPERGITINGVGYIGYEEALHLTSFVPANPSGLKAPPPAVNLITEFELIQLKKSKLSKNHRDWVVREFNKKFKRIEP